MFSEETLTMYDIKTWNLLFIIQLYYKYKMFYFFDYIFYKILFYLVLQNRYHIQFNNM